MFKNMIIAIDGPAGSGKSTSAKLVAQKLGYLYIDTGAMYRAVTYLVLKNNLMGNDEKITSLTEKIDLELNFVDGKTLVRVADEDVTEDIRSIEVNENVSLISKIQGVRKALVKKQQEMGNSAPGVVVEGRDTTTVVFPNADVKIFLTASINERADRRVKEYEGKGLRVSYNDIKDNIAERDKIDSTRDISPLKKAPDALEIDTSKISIESQVDMILEKIKETAKLKDIKLSF